MTNRHIVPSIDKYSPRLKSYEVRTQQSPHDGPLAPSGALSAIALSSHLAPPRLLDSARLSRNGFFVARCSETSAEDRSGDCGREEGPEVDEHVEGLFL